MNDHSGLRVPFTAPLQWQPGAPAADAGAAALRVLATVVSLAERPPQINEEATGLELEVARLHQKTQLLIELLAVALGRDQSRPQATDVQLGGETCQWLSDHPPAVGSEGELCLWLHPVAPEPLRWPARITHCQSQRDGQQQVEATLLPLGEAAQAALDRYVFQQHRRAIAEAKAQRP